MSQRFLRCPQCGKPHEPWQRPCIPPRGGAAPARADLPPPRSPPWPPPQRELVGKTLGRKYILRRVLGGGGMGTVFEAEHRLLGRAVAVKVLHPNLVRSKDAVRRFHREARAAGCIGHPNVCEVHDLDVMDDGTPYMVMEKLVGHTLSRRMAIEGRLPLFDLVDVLLQVLSALTAAHERGIVHRDIKPDNVFLAKRTGCSALAKLLDFGVSKTVRPPDGAEQETDLTRRGMVMGTPHYMSPEQARGDRDLDPRVDLYACGVMLYEGLTGQRPFAGERPADVLRDILHAKPRPARELRRALPSGFDVILARAMARDRDDRYRSAIELQADLRGLRDRIRHEPAPVHPFRSAYPPVARPSDLTDAPTRVWMAPMPGLDDEQKTLVRAPRPRDLLCAMGEVHAPVAEPERAPTRILRGTLRS